MNRIATLCSAFACCAAFSAAAARSGELQKLAITDDGKTLAIMRGQQPMLVYNAAVVPSSDESKPFYQRSGHIHPVYTPSGKLITGDMCADHPHQHAIWFAWTSTIYDGRKIDFWNSQEQQGRVEHVEVLGKEYSDNAASFRINLAHLDLRAPEEPLKVLDETWTVSARESGSAKAFVFDISSQQKCATDKPLVQKQYHYGGMGLRTRMDWNSPHGKFLTSEGKTRENGNHTRPNWVATTGNIDGEPAGIVVMQHPSNFRFPQPVRLHPKFSYFSFSPMVLGEFEIKPGEFYASNYRYVVFDGPLDEKMIDRLWAEYSALSLANAKLADRSDPKFVVAIDADETISVEGRAVAIDELGPLFMNWRKAHRDNDARVLIDAHAKARFQVVIQVMGELSKVGATGFTFKSNRKADEIDE